MELLTNVIACFVFKQAAVRLLWSRVLPRAQGVDGMISAAPEPGRVPARAHPTPSVQRAPAALKSAGILPNKQHLAFSCRSVCGVLAGKVLCSALFHKAPPEVWCMIEKNRRPGEQTCRATQRDQGDCGFFLFLSPSLPVKQLTEIMGIN